MKIGWPPFRREIHGDGGVSRNRRNVPVFIVRGAVFIVTQTPTLNLIGVSTGPYQSTITIRVIGISVASNEVFSDSIIENEHLVLISLNPLGD